MADHPAPSAKRPKTNGAQEADLPLVAGARPFRVERFFAKHEFTAKYMLGSSDAESWTVSFLLEFAENHGDKAAAKEWAEVGLGYTESPGHPELRRAIANLYGESIGPDQVLCVVPEEGIFITMSALLEAGDVVIAMRPAYQSLYEIARARGCEVRPWTAHYEPGSGWSFRLADLRAVLDGCSAAKPKMLVVNAPHNPTSWMPTPAEHAELVSLCQQHGLILFSDEMYWWFSKTEVEESSCTRYSRAVTLGGLSKPYGMPGLRVGWLATQDADIMQRLCQLKDYVTICGSAPSEVLAIIALRHGPAVLDWARARSSANREILRRFCEELDYLFEWASSPSTGLTMFVVLRGWAAEMGAQGFVDWCVKETGCLMVPSDAFEQTVPPAVRFGLGRSNLFEALNHLKKRLLKVGKVRPA